MTDMIVLMFQLLAFHCIDTLTHFVLDTNIIGTSVRGDIINHVYWISAHRSRETQQKSCGRYINCLIKKITWIKYTTTIINTNPIDSYPSTKTNIWEIDRKIERERERELEEMKDVSRCNLVQYQTGKTWSKLDAKQLKTTINYYIPIQQHS